MMANESFNSSSRLALMPVTASIRSAAVRSSGVFRRRAAPCFGEANLRTISRPVCNVFGTRLRVTVHSRRAERCRQTVRMRIASIDGDQREAMCHVGDRLTVESAKNETGDTF